MLQLGISYYHVGNYAEADRLLQQAVALDPTALAATEYLARLRYREGVEAIEVQDYPRAVELLGDYVDQNPTDPEASFNLGLAQLFAEDLSAAEGEFVKTAKLMPQNWEVYDRLGYIYEQKRDYPRSLQNYERAHGLNPDSSIEESIERIQERIQRSE